MHPADLERVVHRRLRQLPAPAAPVTLLPRVMTLVQAWAARPWYERSWFTWPMALRLASAALFVLVAAAGAWFSPSVTEAARGVLAESFGRYTAHVPQLTQRAQEVTSVMDVVWRTLLQRVLLVAFALVVAMGGACAAVALAVNRVVFGRPVHS
jgi:hypothetical protein